MQLHYILRESEEDLFLKIISQEDLSTAKAKIAECQIEDGFVISRTRPELLSYGVFLRGGNSFADDHEVMLHLGFGEIDYIRRLLETAILIKDQRTKKMYERVN